MHQESNEKQIGQVFKDLEEQALTAKVLDPSNYFVARIDGKNFSTFTRPFKTMAKQTMGQNGYYCPLITEIMVLTTKDLVKKFGAVTGYTQSDEISLLFAPAKTEEKMANAKPGRIFDHPHSGRIVKLCTLMASYASARFNCHANYFAQHALDLTEHAKSSLESGEAYFDCRLLEFKPQDTALMVEYFWWRSRYDCRRNSRMAFARHFFSDKQLHKMTGFDACKKVFDEKGIDWNNCPNEFRYGVWVKRQRIVQEAVNAKTNQTEQCTRSKFVSCALDLTPGMDDVRKILFENDWPETVALTQ